MSSLCAYRFCTSKSEHGNDHLSYHRFPVKDQQLLQKWLAAMSKPDSTLTSRHVLCSAHFEGTEFQNGGQRRRLREGAVPSRFCAPTRKGTQLQEKEGLKAADKLSRAHIEYYRQIVKVKLAAQTFSASVSKALEFASQLDLPGFEGCDGTAKFIRMVDRAFDLLNSSSPVANCFKTPLRPSTFHYQKEAMEHAGRELMALQLASGRLLVQDSKRMSVISLAFTLKTVAHLAQAIFQADLCSCIRQRGGWNNTPSAAQFRHTYRRTLVHARVLSSSGANVVPQLE
ncbi:hypothetical protein HPB50_015577 [Hyalomma asiaticum]|uniref:Uncharacterized protein n=1 Tax=Hyalomma asiaticum TaxID=266040 RepID=A0ACB7SFL9_HYAAI|nr:hypothetical protein HPB50_015577 [Hyalomma asiaticum]